MGRIFNLLVTGFTSFFNSIVNGTLFSAIASFVDDFYYSLPAPLHYLLALVVIACIFYLIKNIASFILEVIKP